MQAQQIFPKVHIGSNVVLQDWVVIGLPPPGTAPGQLETVIEDGAIIRSHTVIYAGCQIGQGFQTGHRVIVGPGSEIGDNCSIGTSSVLKGFAKLDRGSKIHSFCSIGMFSRVQEKAWVGPRCTFESNAQNPVIVAPGAIIGTTVYIAPGVRVGEKCLIAAGVALIKDVPPYHLIAGHPARSIKNITRLTCPYELIDRPYEPDEPAVQAAVNVRHQARRSAEDECQTWRYQLWHSLGRPQPWF